MVCFHWPRVQEIKRVAILLQLHPRPPSGSLQDRTVKDYATYKKVILFFALVDQLYASTLSGVSAVPSNEAEWPSALADWIRSNDDALMKASARVLTAFQVCATTERFRILQT